MWFRCESFNGLMRQQNLHSNRHASSCDIAVRFARTEHIRHLLHGGSPRYLGNKYLNQNKVPFCYCCFSCEVGAGLLDLAGKREVQKKVFNDDAKDMTRAIYQPGALRKVSSIFYLDQIEGYLLLLGT